MSRVLAINCGSTSTKVAVFDDDRLRSRRDLEVPPATSSPDVLAQLPERVSAVREFLAADGTAPGDLDIVVARAGAVRHVPRGGAYEVNRLMLDSLRYAPAAQHASSLSCFIGVELVAGLRTPVIVYDPTSVDCVDEVARLTGVPEITNLPVFHLLNTRAAGIEHARTLGRRYEDLDLVIAQLGGGITLGFHDHGRVADWVYDDEGPISPQRAGRIPTRFLVDLCYSGRYTHREMRTYLAGRSGMLALLGTHDLREVERRIDAGDARADLVHRAMALGVAKAVGELSVVRGGHVDAIVLTGGLAHSALFTGRIRELVSWIAPVAVVPGEREMEALAAGGLRVLAGEEKIQPYTVLPPGYASAEELRTRPGVLA